MNYLFYVGIIVPTVITIAIFVIFIYCWFLQKARKEVLTKKYDPHGKMKSLGMSMHPPPPPTFCLMEDLLVPEIGEDNVAYDVSRSPSTEQDARGRPLYQSYHDSGISAGLSPTQDGDGQRCLLYRTFPDSGISEVGSQSGQSGIHVSRNCCRGDEGLLQQPQLHYVFGDQVQVHSHQNQQFHPQPHHASLHNDLAHSIHGVCYSDDTLLQNSADYNTSGLGLTNCSDGEVSLFGQTHPSSTNTSTQHQQPKRCVHTKKNVHQQNGQLVCQGSQENNFIHPLQSQLRLDHIANSTVSEQNGTIPEHHLPNRIIPEHSLRNRTISEQHPPNRTISDHHLPNRSISTVSVLSSHIYTLPDTDTSCLHNSNNTSPISSPPINPLSQYYTDSGITDMSQPHSISIDRPDSQASHSSTTDSEDSGFRSSYCAAHHKNVLSKQGNPLLKSLRRTKKTGKTAGRNCSKTTKTAGFKPEHSRTNQSSTRLTLSPHNLHLKSKNTHSVGNSSKLDSENIQRRSRDTNGNPSKDKLFKSSCAAENADVFNLQASSIKETFLQTSSCDNWPPQSSNDVEVAVKQSIDLNDISNHMSWTYLQNHSTCGRLNTEFLKGGMVLQPCEQSSRTGQGLQTSEDQHSDIYGYSIV